MISIEITSTYPETTSHRPSSPQNRLSQTLDLLKKPPKQKNTSPKIKHKKSPPPPKKKNNGKLKISNKSAKKAKPGDVHQRQTSSSAAIAGSKASESSDINWIAWSKASPAASISSWQRFYGEKRKAKKKFFFLNKKNRWKFLFKNVYSLESMCFFGLFSVLTACAGGPDKEVSNIFLIHTRFRQWVLPMTNLWDLGMEHLRTYPVWVLCLFPCGLSV